LRTTNGAKALERVLAARHARGVNLPYGPAVIKLGLAPDGPLPAPP
jgi:hypothetical protein